MVKSSQKPKKKGQAVVAVLTSELVKHMQMYNLVVGFTSCEKKCIFVTLGSSIDI